MELTIKLQLDDGPHQLNLTGEEISKLGAVIGSCPIKDVTNLYYKIQVAIGNPQKQSVDAKLPIEDAQPVIDNAPLKVVDQKSKKVS